MRILRSRILLAVVMQMVVTVSLAPGQAAKKDLAPGEVMPIVAKFLERYHFTGHSLDDVISRRAFDLYIESLDPLKLYFLQSDIDEFAERKDLLDNDLRRGRGDFAEKVFNRLVLRMNSRVAHAEKLLAGTFDFTKEEVLVTEPDAAHFAADLAEADDLWRRRVKFDLLDLKYDGVEGAEAIKRLTKRYSQSAKRTAEIDHDEIYSLFINAVTTAYDPHSTYMSPRSQETFEINMRLNYQGIGAHLQEEDGYTTIASVIPGGAAAKHGKLVPKDRIVGVAQGLDGEFVDVVGMKLSDVVPMIRGKEGTIVRLAVLPTAGGKKQIYTLTRAQIQLEDRAATGRVVENGQMVGERPLKIGIIDLPSFYADIEAQSSGKEDSRSSARDVARLLEGFKKEGVDAVILDLRFNGGGYLPQAVEVTGLFLDRGPVVQVKDPGRQAQVLNDRISGVAWGGPLVVLTSKSSASASEILAGAVRDYQRGLVVGDATTHGKGTVQTVLDLADQVEASGGPGSLGALKLTFRQFFLPDGQSTQLQGVPSDIVIPSWMAEISMAEGDLPYAVKGDTVPRVEHADYSATNPEMVARLKKASDARRATSQFFKDLDHDIETYRRFKAMKDRPLNEKRYMALQAELERGRKKQQETAAEGAGAGENADTKVKDDPWFNEVLSITSDYAKLLAGREI